LLAEQWTTLGPALLTVLRALPSERGRTEKCPKKGRFRFILGAISHEKETTSKTWCEDSHEIDSGFWSFAPKNRNLRETNFLLWGLLL